MKYNNDWEFQRDLFLFETSLFPFFYKMNYSLKKSISWSKKENKDYYIIFTRLLHDTAGKIYVKGAYKNPTIFEKTICKKYEGKSIEQIQNKNNWYLDT